VSIKSFPDYKYLLQENYVEYKHIQTINTWHTILETNLSNGKEKYVYIPRSFLVINFCNQGKTSCSPCIYVHFTSVWCFLCFLKNTDLARVPHIENVLPISGFLNRILHIIPLTIFHSYTFKKKPIVFFQVFIRHLIKGKVSHLFVVEVFTESSVKRSLMMAYISQKLLPKNYFDCVRLYAVKYILYYYQWKKICDLGKQTSYCKCQPIGIR